MFEETRPHDLQVGDHICMRGVPGYRDKHPLGCMANMHGVVVGHSLTGEPYIGGLEFNKPRTISEIEQDLVDAYNYSQNALSIEIQKLRKHKLNENIIFKKYTIQEVKNLDGCKVINENTCRLSPQILTSLKIASCQDNLQAILYREKALSLARKNNNLYKMQTEHL